MGKDSWAQLSSWRPTCGARSRRKAPSRCQSQEVKLGPALGASSISGEAAWWKGCLSCVLKRWGGELGKLWGEGRREGDIPGRTNSTEKF